MTAANGDSTATRTTLQRVATHVLARRRHDVTGRFGLRAAPGGLATPAFGTDAEVLRTRGDVLVHEAGGRASAYPISGSTLRTLADAVGADITSDFSCGADTPPVGDPDEPLTVAVDAALELAAWWAQGAEVLDRALLEVGTEATVSQLWPEHFDLATTATLADGAKVNIGFSPGDSYLDEPYCYVGPWSSDRPGDPLFWNAPFGAVLTRADAAESDTCLSLIRRAFALLQENSSP